MSYLPQIKNGKILDIGCAGGAWLQIVKQNGWECYGVDFVESGQNQENIEIRYGYLPELSYPEEYFDVITAWGVLEHVHEPSRYFETVFRLLKKKGAFIFMVPNGDSLWSRWAYKEDTPRHLHSFRPSTLKKYAQKYGYYFKKIDFTNDVYSHPSSGRGMIKRQLLRKFGIPWSEIIEPSHRFTIKALGKAAGLLDHCLIHPKIEKLFHVSGTIVVILTKEI
ncbi:MAG: class I SAM-dependent methyltransferase [Candidatus Omnitrophica bacterium]|nr:class I SAM-dependent methyltransferase [Candidatus Omnitrophota bacterium]